MILNPKSKKFIPFLTVFLALMVAMSPFAIDTYLSGMPVMAKYFDVSLNKIELTLTLYFLGFAIGNFIGGPFSDVFGRKTIVLVGAFIYGVSAYSISFATKIEYVWILRVTQAFGGGFASVTSMVFVRDWFQGKQVARLATIISMIMMFAPLLAPVIGSTFLVLWGWQSIFIFLSIFASIVFVIFLFFVPESRPKIYLTKKITAKQLIGKYLQFFQNKQAILMLFTIAFAMSGMFTFITGVSFIYLEYFKMPENIFPILFGSNVILNVIMSLSNSFLLKKYEPIQLMKLGLAIQFTAGLTLLCGSIFIPNNFFIVFIPIVFFIGSLGMVFGNGTAIILNLVPEISGSANATIGITRFVISFIVGSIPALFSKTNLIPITIVMFICTLIANIFMISYKNNRD